MNAYRVYRPPPSLGKTKAAAAAAEIAEVLYQNNSSRHEFSIFSFLNPFFISVFMRGGGKPVSISRPGAM
jgi:hypothetical protein